MIKMAVIYEPAETVGMLLHEVSTKDLELETIKSTETINS